MGTPSPFHTPTGLAKVRADNSLKLLRSEAPAWVFELLIPYIDARIEEQAERTPRRAAPGHATPPVTDEDRILDFLGVDLTKRRKR
jgi:hypothetical protein